MRMIALAAILLSLAVPAAATVRHDPKRNILLVSGPIGWDDPCRAAGLLMLHPTVTLVHIDSPGGDAWAGAQLGRVFGYAGLAAVIPPHAQALSAAGVAALGARTLRIQGHLGLHGPYAVHPTALFSSQAVAEAVTEMREVLESAGLPPWQVSLALSHPPDRFLPITQRIVDQRHYRMQADPQRLAALHLACGALTALLGEPARKPT